MVEALGGGGRGEGLAAVGALEEGGSDVWGARPFLRVEAAVDVGRAALESEVGDVLAAHGAGGGGG